MSSRQQDDAITERMKQERRPKIAEAVQQEADDLLELAQQLEAAAKETRKDAAALRAHARGLKVGEIGLLPGWGYDYANMRLSTLRRDWPPTPPVVCPTCKSPRIAAHGPTVEAIEGKRFECAECGEKF